MRKTLIFTLVLVTAIAFVSILYFSALTTSNNQHNKTLSFIPADAALVGGFRYDESFLEIFKNYQPFNAILGEEKRVEIHQVQNVLLLAPNALKATQGQKVFLSFHPTSKGMELLWNITLNGEVNQKGIFQKLVQSKEIAVQKEPAGFYSIFLKRINKTFYLSLSDQNALGSFSKALITKALDKNLEKIDKIFIAEISNDSQKNSNAPFNLFINHPTISQFIANFFRSKLDVNFNFLKDMGGFSTLSMNFKSDALMFNGISTTDTSSNNYLNLFLHQKPINNTIKKVFPANTANFLAFGISNNRAFNNDLRALFRKRGELQGLEQQLQKIRSKTGVNFERDIEPFWGKEFATVQLANGEKLAVIKVLNGQKLEFFMEPVSWAYTENIRRLINSNILYYYFGDPLRLFPRPLYAVIDNHLIIANTASAIQRFLSDYKAEKLLNKTSEFLEFNQLVANQSNIFYFAHNKNSQQIVKNKLQQAYTKAFAANESGLKDFYGLSFQWSSQNSHFFTNVYASYQTPESELSEALWAFKMNAAIALAPQVLIHTDGNPFLMVQDKTNRLYALSTEGKKLWNIQPEGRILGGIHQLGDQTIVFNTTQKIFRITPDGKNVANFPVSLPQNASYAATITSKDTDFNLFIPCNNIIVAYDAFGKPLKGWPKMLNGKILFDIKLTALNNTNYLIAGTDNAQFYFFNHNGNLIKKVTDSKKRRFRNPLAIEIKTNLNDSRIITTDTTGMIRSIFFDGNMLHKSISAWTPTHFFDYKNISGDIKPELVFLDKNQLYVYSSDSTLVYNYEFPYPIINEPQFFTENQSSYQIGISSAKDQLLYLFNSDGTLAKGFPFKGEPNFYIGDLKKDGKIYLICGMGNNLYAYQH